MLQPLTGGRGIEQGRYNFVARVRMRCEDCVDASVHLADLPCDACGHGAADRRRTLDPWVHCPGTVRAVEDGGAIGRRGRQDHRDAALGEPRQEPMLVPDPPDRHAGSMLAYEARSTIRFDAKIPVERPTGDYVSLACRAQAEGSDNGEGRGVAVIHPGCQSILGTTRDS
jgi:hypothetical protein